MFTGDRPVRERVVGGPPVICASPTAACYDYVIPGGLVPLRVDRQARAAAYREPNIWIIHRTQ